MGAEDRQAIAVLTRAHELKPDDPVARRLLAEELSISAEHHAQHQEMAMHGTQTSSRRCHRGPSRPGSPETFAKAAQALAASG